ncbi:MAG: hypothetical protein WBG57_09380 [Ornithinimicrobium sp.]
MGTVQLRAATVGAGTAAAVVMSALVLPGAAHADPQGYIEVETGVGYFYGTFEQDPNYVLIVGGSAEEFCDDAPDDPFGNAEPGTATARIFERNGVTKIKVNSSNQPLYLYEYPTDGPEFIAAFCDIYFDDDPATTVPEPVAQGSGNLKVRTTVFSESAVDVFNSVNGTLEAADGTNYKVRAAADVFVQDGMPVGEPADFVSFSLKEIGR